MSARDWFPSPKPRVSRGVSGLWWAERIAPGGLNEASVKNTFQEAIDIALEWAGPKESK